MTNEELALHIADGETDLIGELYQPSRYHKTTAKVQQETAEKIGRGIDKYA